MITPPPLPLLPLPVGGCIGVNDISNLHPSTAAEVASEQTFNFYCEKETEGISTSEPVAILMSYVQKEKGTKPKPKHADLAGWVGLHFGDCVHKVEIHIVDDSLSECNDTRCISVNVETVCVKLHYGDDKCISAKYKSAKKEDYAACVKAAKDLINYRYKNTIKDADLSNYTDRKFYAVETTPHDGKKSTQAAAWARNKLPYKSNTFETVYMKTMYLPSFFPQGLFWPWS